MSAPAPEIGRAPLPVAAAGCGWLLIDKPCGLSVHNDPGRDACSLLSAWLAADPRAAAACRFDPAFGVHPVHRLDSETSGLLLLACRRPDFDHLARQFAQGAVSKHYLAIVHGRPAGPPDGEWGLWAWSLTPRAAGHRNPQGSGPRSDARTSYRILRTTRHYTLLACRPLTGRTHQIRRHAVLAGHPVLGDRRYGPARARRWLEHHAHFTRLALHAAELEIRLPGAEAPARFGAMRLPAEMERILVLDE